MSEIRYALYDDLKEIRNLWEYSFSEEESFLNYYFEGINYFDIYDYIKAVTLEDINDRLREHFDETMAVLSIINPIESVGN